MSMRALGVLFQHARSEDLPTDQRMFWHHNPEEKAKLDRLTVSLLELMRPPWPESDQNVENTLPPRRLSSDEISVDKVMMAVDTVLRMFIRFSKSVPEFNRLQQSDQITLLKASAMRMYCLRLAHNYYPERASWITSVGEMPLDYVIHLFKDPNLFSAIRTFCEGTKFVVFDNPTLYALVKVMVLFDPRVRGVQDTNVVNSAKDHYLLLLKHYLEGRYSFLHANRYFTELMLIYEDLDKIGQIFVQFLTNYDTRLHPLIAEFLNI
jgi:hypothetical protein